MAPGETDDDEEDHVGSEEGGVDRDGIDSDDEVAGYQPLPHLQCYDCAEPVCPRGSRCTACSLWNYACPETGLCISPERSDWLKISSSKPDFMKAARGGGQERRLRVPFHRTPHTGRPPRPGAGRKGVEQPRRR